jgi:hypothetical protein
MQITLTDAQYARLQAESRVSGSPIAELVRRSIDGAYGPALLTSQARLGAARAARGSWGDRGDDVLADWRAMRGDRPHVDS